MSQGLEAINKAILLNSLSLYRSIQRIWLVEAEVSLHNTITQYITQYGSLPNLAVLNGYGFELQDALESPFDYYIDRLYHRYVHNTASANLSDYNSAIRNGSIDGIIAIKDSLTQAIATRSSSGLELVSYTDVAREGMERVRQNVYRSLMGFTTGYDVLDQITGGFQTKNVEIFVGRINTGKTYHLLHSMFRSWMSGTPIMLVSMEMSEVQMALRMLAIQAGVNPDHFKNGTIATYHHRIINSLIDESEQVRAPFYFLRSARKKHLKDIEAAIDQVGSAQIFIDSSYLLSLDGSGKNKYKSRTDNITEVVEESKLLADRTDTNIVQSVQFNRNVKTIRRRGATQSNDLVMENIGGSDSIGQIASNVIGIHPPALGVPNERILELMKNREGGLIKFKTRFDFEPRPNFDFIEVITDEPEAAAENEAAQGLMDMDWMQ